MILWSAMINKFMKNMTENAVKHAKNSLIMWLKRKSLGYGTL
jgi:hypothetical protein